MLLTTTSVIEGHQIDRYLGIVSSEVVLGANAIKDMMAGFRDFFGGRSNSYERAFQETREAACCSWRAIGFPDSWNRRDDDGWSNRNRC